MITERFAPCLLSSRAKRTESHAAIPPVMPRRMF